MTNWTELKRLAEVRKSAGWKTMDSVELETILALIAENERLRADGNDVFGLAQARADTIDQLRAEVEALRKDAERYRHLKDQGHFRAMSFDMGGNHSWTGMGRHVGKGPTVDEAIDSEIARIKAWPPKSTN